MHPVLFSFGSVGIYTYGLFVALGLFTAIGVTKKLTASHGVESQTVTDLFFAILVGSIVGARLLYVIINFEVYQDNWLEIFKIWNGGLVFFGGFVTAVAAAVIFIKKKNLEVWKTADLLAPGIALGHSVGRIGCFFAGCCYGKTCDLPFAIQFNHPKTLAPMGVHLHPTQIYMVLSNLTIFLILIFLLKRKRFNGQVFLSYLMIYSVFRFLIEFFRGDARGTFFIDFLSTSQGIGIITFLTALVLFIVLKNKSKVSTGSHGNH